MTAAYDHGEDGTLRAPGRALDVRSWRWVPSSAERHSSSGTAHEAMARLGPHGLRHLVVGVIGPRAATDAQVALAETVGHDLGALGLTVICGGRGGVMEAACRGVARAGGLSIGLLPGKAADEANAHVGIPLPTGLNEGRNMVIAQAARLLIAVGGSSGTLSEIAFGLHFGKPVIGLDDAPDIDGVGQAADAGEAVEMACASLIEAAGGA